jgi:uncharacterized membrane protein
MKNKQGQLGMGTVKVVMIGFLILSVLAVAITLSMVELRDVTEKIDQSTGTLTNVTLSSVVNATGGFPTGITSDTRACSLTITEVYNATNKSITYNTGNFTTDGCLIKTTGTGLTAGIINHPINVTGTFSNANPDTNDLTTNVTSGITGFFDDTSTIFAILIVIVIILAIAIIISVVGRFGGVGGISGEGSSDTVTGS